MGDVLHVVAAVIRADGRILVCRRRPEKAAGGLWEFPGGKVEKGESPEDALRREIAEELAVDIRVLGSLTTNDTIVDDLIIRLSCYRATLQGSSPTSSTDHDRLKWVSVDEMNELDWAEPDLPAVELLIAELNSGM